jgi:uncharacterized membrane protein
MKKIIIIISIFIIVAVLIQTMCLAIVNDAQQKSIITLNRCIAHQININEYFLGEVLTLKNDVANLKALVWLERTEL